MSIWIRDPITKRLVHKLPSKSSKCPICYSITNYTTKCNHSFCYSCLIQWYRKDVLTRCPVCRESIDDPYPKTRAHKEIFIVKEHITNLLKRQKIYKKQHNNILLEILCYIWENRRIFRIILSKSFIVNKIKDLETQYKKYNLEIPVIIYKFKCF